MKQGWARELDLHVSVKLGGLGSSSDAGDWARAPGRVAGSPVSPAARGFARTGVERASASTDGAPRGLTWVRVVLRCRLPIAVSAAAALNCMQTPQLGPR